MKKFLIIQTAFIGDVVLATALIEKLHAFYPEARIDFLLRKGNESLLANNPYITDILIWNKKENKIRNLISLLRNIRERKYDVVINLQRYFSTGLLTGFSRGKLRIGFNKNPLSFLFNKTITHVFDLSHPKHEVERNNELISSLTDATFTRPVLYPSEADVEAVSQYIQQPYITISPSSVWFTKKYPAEKWIDLMDEMNPSYRIFLLGSKDNIEECASIANASANKQTEILAGKLSFLQSASLMRNAVMNYTNDSAPLHFASGVNAPVTAVFCSTVPAFGYTPLSDISYIVETQLHLKCRPCGLHGYKACPLGHFKCAHSITTNQLMFPDADR